MLRFAELMRLELTKRGHEARILQPEQVFRAPPMVRSGKWAGYVDKYVLYPPRLRQLVQWADVVHICDHSNAVYVPFVKSKPTVVTVHDLLAVRAGLGEETYCPLNPTGCWLQRWILWSLRQAAHLICDSEATKSDTIRLTAGSSVKTIDVAHLGLNADFSKITQEAARGTLSKYPELNPAEAFVLLVGSGQPRKNREGAMRAFALVKEEFKGQLVFAGAPLESSQIALAETLQIADRICAINKPSDAVLKALYNCAHCLLFPSKSEGFGWPIIEAQACACPVLASGSPPCPEIAGEGALTHPFEDDSGFAKSILELLSPTVRNRVISAGLDNLKRFSTNKMIDAYEAVYVMAMRTS